MPEHELKLNDAAPDFQLKNGDGNAVRLSSFKGKQAVILFFYPGDFTPGCTLQLCSIRDEWQKFKEKNVAIFGVNHGDAASHLVFREKYHFPFPLLIDTDKKISKRYGATRSILKAQVIRRSVVGVDKDGVIRYLKRGMPRNQDILKAMRSYL